ncbi:MAG: hypothetical protein IM556_06480 [Pseudanabaena sp. M110S1SP2A07QC]|nr:hypothetical protein [Pseudanabaena sp. M110S1SP2A07QC]
MFFVSGCAIAFLVRWLRDRVFVVGWAIVFLWLVEAIALLRGMSGRSLFW